MLPLKAEKFFLPSRQANDNSVRDVMAIYFCP
jgi:hypothetical protein